MSAPEFSIGRLVVSSILGFIGGAIGAACFYAVIDAIQVRRAVRAFRELQAFADSYHTRADANRRDANSINKPTR